MRTLFLGLTLLIAGASCAAAQTLLDTVLYVVSAQEAEDIGVRRITVTQDAESLNATLFGWFISAGNPGALKNSGSIFIRRVTDCRFAVDFSTSRGYTAHYSADFFGADFAGAFLTDVPNMPQSRSLVVPGAIWCHVAGRPNFKLGEPACAGTSAVFSAFGRRNDGKMLAAIRRLEKLCIAKVSLLQ